VRTCTRERGEQNRQGSFDGEEWKPTQRGCAEAWYSPEKDGDVLREEKKSRRRLVREPEKKQGHGTGRSRAASFQRG